jgi:hypothetical protein
MSFVPRRRVLAREDGLVIWRVDGHAVRDALDVEFTNGANHLHAPYVPFEEIWLDREAPGGEEWRFWAHYQRVHRRRMIAGATYLEAVASAERAERRVRRRALGLRGRLSVTRLRELARRRKLGVVDGLAVYVVRGRVVRDQAYLHFTLGGHGYRYRFIPKDEVWIDDAVAPAERAAILHHEIVELELMRGRDMGYDEAHARASRAEVRFRRETAEATLPW